MGRSSRVAERRRIRQRESWTTRRPFALAGLTSTRHGRKVPRQVTPPFERAQPPARPVPVTRAVRSSGVSDPLATLTPCALLSRNFRSYLGWSAAWSRPEAALCAGERAAPPEGGIPARAASTSARSDPRHCKRACSDRSRGIYGDIQSGGATAPPRGIGTA